MVYRAKPRMQLDDTFGAVRLPRRRPDRTAAQREHHAAAGAEPAQQRLHARSRRGASPSASRGKPGPTRGAGRSARFRSRFAAGRAQEIERGAATFVAGARAAGVLPRRCFNANEFVIILRRHRWPHHLPAGRWMPTGAIFLRLGGTGLSRIALASLYLREQRLLGREGTDPARDRSRASARAAAAALRAEGEARADHLLLRRVQPPRHVRLQAGADQARRPADARRREARHVPGRERQPRRSRCGRSSRAGSRGKMISDLLPAPRRAGRRHVLHPLDDREEQHARPGREPDEHRLHARRLPEHGRVGELRAGQREPRTCRRSSRSPTRAACRRSGRTTGQRLPARPSSRARRSTPTSRSATSPGRRSDRARRRRGHARLPEAAQRRAPRRSIPATRELAARIASYELAARMQLARRRGRATCRSETRGDVRDCTAPTTRTRSRPASPATACSPGGCSSAACGSCSCSTAPTRWARASATGTATRRSRQHYDVHGPILDQPARGAAHAT